MSATTGSLTSKLDHRSWLAWLARDGERDLARNLVLLSVFLLVSIGTVMVFSAAAFHWAIRDDTFYFLRKQLAWVAIAGLGGLFFYQIDYRLLRRCYWQLLVLSTILLFAVLIPQLGTDVNQARRWIRLGGGLQFQPSELAKLSVIVFVAAFLANDPERRRRFLGGFLVVCFAISPLVLLILFEPDLGTSLFVLGIAVMLLIVGGMRLSYMLVVGVVFAPIVGYAAHLRWDEIRDRVMGFLDPESVYQVKHSLTALGAGGWSGKGLGAGGQKLGFLPEAHTDFILAIVGEELGYLGTIAVIALFILLVWGGIGILWRARDLFGFLLGAGIVLSLASQALLNVAVVTASAPTKGIALPFVTFGGSGLFMALCQIGVLLSIDRVWREDPQVAELNRKEQTA